MKKKIALVTGGYSREAEISYQSFITVNNNVDRDRYNVYVIDITPEEWFYKNENEEHIPVDKNDFSITVNNNKINFFIIKKIQIKKNRGSIEPLSHHFGKVSVLLIIF